MTAAKTKLRALSLIEGGMSVPKVAKRFRRHPSVIYGWVKKAKAEIGFGVATPKVEGGQIPYDVAAPNPSKDAILYLRAARATFGPVKTLTRGQVLTLLALTTLEGN